MNRTEGGVVVQNFPQNHAFLHKIVWISDCHGMSPEGYHLN